MDSRDELDHFGVMGMHWGQHKGGSDSSGGVRNDQGHQGAPASNRKMGKLDKKFEKNAGSTKTFMEIYNKGASDFNNKIGAINNKPAYKKAADDGSLLNPKSQVYKTYHKEAQDELVSSMNKAANSLGTNASGTKRLGAHVLDGSAPGVWNLVLEDVKHDSQLLQLKVTRDSKGLITKVEIVPDGLTHFGVMGMHWGHRKSAPSSQPTGPRRKRSVTEKVLLGPQVSKRIDESMSKGKSFKKSIAPAVGKTLVKDLGKSAAIELAGMGIAAMIIFGPAMSRQLSSGIVNNANTKRGQRAFSDLMGLGMSPQKVSKISRAGVHTITSFR
jgi:hypothetical protein